MTPAAMLRGVMGGAGLGLRQTARLSQLSAMTLSRVLDGSARVTPRIAVRLGKLSGIPAAEWLDAQSKRDLSRLRKEEAYVLARIPCLRED